MRRKRRKLKSVFSLIRELMDRESVERAQRMSLLRALKRLSHALDTRRPRQIDTAVDEVCRTVCDVFRRNR